MSQSLPAHPDLEHLRKQAKALLRDLRTRDPEAKLADALHLVGVAEIDVDGAEHVAENGYALTAAWRTPHMLETIAAKGGERVGSGQYEVSPDGLTLTITGPEQVIVLVRA